MPVILPVKGIMPTFGKDCYIAPNATIVGDVVNSLLSGTAPAADPAFFAALMVTAFALSVGWWLFKRLSPYFEDFL